MEETMSLMERLALHYPSFSKGQKRIADFIRDNYDVAATYTAAKLGVTVGVSESTVVRFANELGYEGYPALLKAIAATVRTHSNSLQRLEHAAKILESQESPLAAMFKADRTRLSETEAVLDQDIFDQAVDAIIKADNIYILGVRSTWYLAGMMGYYFRMIFDRVQVLEGTGNADTLEAMCRIKENDVFIGISFPRYSMRTARAMEFAKKHGATTVTITDSMESPLIEYADYPLIAKSDVVAIVDSLTAPLSLVNALVVAICMKKKDEMEERLHVLEELWNEYRVYDDHVIKQENSL